MNNILFNVPAILFLLYIGWYVAVIVLLYKIWRVLSNISQKISDLSNQ